MSLTFITVITSGIRSPRSVFTDGPHIGSVPDRTKRANGSSVPAEYRAGYQYRRPLEWKLFTQVAHVGLSPLPCTGPSTPVPETGAAVGLDGISLGQWPSVGARR